MADDKAIRQLVGRARRQWLTTAMINAGGRYALLPIALFSVLGMVFTAGAWAGNFTVYILLVLAIFAALTVPPIFFLVRIVYATSRSRGAPDWALLLDRALNSRDMIPSWLEATPDFKPAIAAQIEIPSKIELGLKRNWGNLFLMLMLLAMPFGLMQWQDTPERPDQQENIADLETEQEVPPSVSPEDTPPVPEESGEEDDENASSSSGGGSSEDGDGDIENPHSDNGEETTPEQPETENPESAEPEQENGSSNDSGDGDGTPPEPEKNEIDPEEVDPNRVTPESRDGDTIKRDRKKWVYDPDGENIDGTKLKPSSSKISAEHALPRTSMTNEERATVKKLQKLYK